MHGTTTKDMRFAQAIERYLAEAGEQFGHSHTHSLLFIGRQAIGQKYIGKLNNVDFAQFSAERLKTVKPQTLNGDMIAIRTVLRYAKMMWGVKVDLVGFEEVVLGLRYARKIKSSSKRSRLPTSDELQALTNYFYDAYTKRNATYPMHLIMWFAIYTARRESEITRLLLDDFSGHWYLVRDMKNPKGSAGNHKELKIPTSALPIIQALKAQNSRMKNSKYYDKNKLVPLDSKTISANFTRACHVLGIEDLHFHDLRHEAATRLAECGLSIPQMQQITGHDSWGSLQRYTNLKNRPAVLEFDTAIQQAIKNR